MRIVEDPTLGRLTYPDSMSDAQIYADIDNRLMGLLTPKPKTSALGQVKEFGKQLIPGAGGLLEQAAKGVAGYGADVLQQKFGVGPGAEPVVGGISALTQKYVKEPLGEYFEPAPGYEVAPKLGQAVGSVLGIAATRGLGRTAPLATGMGAGAGEQVERAIEAGASPERRMQAAGMGALVGLTEALPIELAFARTMKLMPGSVMNQGLQVVRNAALTGGVEAAQEAAQNFLQNLIAKNVYKPDQELIAGVGEGAAYGAGAGAIFQAALDLTVGRRAVRATQKAQEAKTPQEAAEKVAEEVANPELTEEEKKQRQRAEIRQKQLDRGINLIDEDDLTALGIKPGKKAEAYNKLLGKNLSDPDELEAIRKTFDNYLSGTRQKLNDITTIQRVLDKQIAGEPLDLFETLVAKNYNGEDIDAYLDGLITNLQARGPAAVVPPIPTPPSTPLTKEQQYAQTLQRMRELGLKTEAELEAEAKQTGKERKESESQLKQLKKLGVPVEAITRGEALAGAQPDLFGDITTQQGTRGTGAEAEFARQRAQFEENLRQLRVASGAAVAGVPDADTVVQATAARVKQDIATIPFSIPELLQVRNYIVRQGAEVPGAENLLLDIDNRIAELGGTAPDESAQMEMFPQEQGELPLGIQGELFEPAPAGTLPTEEVPQEGLNKAGLRELGIAPNSKTMQDVAGKNLTDPGVAEAIRAELERVVQARANDLKKAETNVALSPDKELANIAVQEARARYANAQRNLELFPLLEQPRLPFDTGRGAVLPEAFPTPTQQEEERRFRRIEKQEIEAETAAAPEVTTSDDIQQLIDTIRPLRGPINKPPKTVGDKVIYPYTPEQARTYDDNLMALFQAVKGPGRIQLQFDVATPQSLDLNRAVAKAEGFLRNLSKTERNRLAARLMEERGRTASREQVTKVMTKQGREELETFPEEERTEEGGIKTGLRKDIREQKAEDARVARAQEEERRAKAITPSIQVRAAVTAVSQYQDQTQDKLKKQLNITSLGDVRKLAEAYVGIDDKLDVPGFVKAVSDIPLNRFKELYENEILRITNIDIRETKRKETAASEAEEEAKRVEAEKKEEQAKKDVETAKKAVDTRIESMPAKPLADVIEDVVDIDGGKAYPFLRAISKSDVSTKLQQRIDSVFGKVKGVKLTEEEIVAEVEALEKAEKKAKKEGKAAPEISKQTKKLKKEYETNKWEVFDIDPTYIVLRSGEKYAVITPARFSAKEIAQDFKTNYPSIKPVEVSSGMAMNTRYVVFTAPAVETRPAEPIASKRTRGLQRLATERFDKAVLEVRNEIGKSTYKDLADGTTIDRLVDKFGLERTVRALMDEAATRESQREKVGEFMMDDRVLGKAMEYLKGTYGVVVQFSMAKAIKQDKNIKRSLAPPGIEPNKGFYDSLIKETDKNTYNAEKMLADVSKYEGSTEIGRVARMLLNSSVIPKYELQNIHVTRGTQDGSYYANFFEDGKRRSFISMGREHVAHPETGLHEIVHGLAVSQVTRVQNPRYISTGAEWETAADNLINLYRLVDRYYITDNINKPEPYGLTDVNEFISEAIVNEDFKNYLKSISIADMRKKLTSSEQTMFNKLIIGTKNMFQAFTKLLRKTLGLPDSSQTVFDLAIDNIGTLIAGTPGPLITKGTMRDMDSISRKVATPNKYGRDPVPADVIKILDSIKNNPALNVPVFRGKEDAVLAVKTGALPFLAVNQLRDIYSSNPRLTELKDYYESTQRMGGYRNMLREKYANALNDFHKVRKAYKGKPLVEQLDEVINEGSRLEVDVLKPSKDYTDPVAKADHARLQAMYDKFPEDVKSFYKKYRDTNGFVLDEIKKSMIARAQSYVTDPADKAEIKAMIEKKIDSFKEKGPYAPLMFFGNNWVTVQMAEDKVLPFSFETLSQAKEFAKEMKAKGYETKSFESIKELKAKGAPRAGFFKELEKVLDRNRVNPKAKDELYQMTLMYLPEESFMRQFQNRKGAPTYERDALRNYEELADRVVHQLPRARYMIDMDNAIEAMKNKVKQDPDDVSSRVVAEIEKHYDSSIQPKISPAATFLGNLGFAWYMGANPSAALVQLFQISGVTAPYLYPVYGINNVNSELYQAARDFFGGKTEVGRGIFSIKNNPNLTATEKKAIQELYDLNVIPPAATEVGDIETMTGLKSSTPMERTLKKINMIMGYMFQNAERFNREVTALAAFRLEYNRSKDYAKAMQAANDTVVETQGDYSDVGTARVFKHPAAKVLLMFKKFMQMMIYMYSRNMQIMMQKGFTPEEKRIARNRLTGLLAASAMTSGVTGMPFYWIAETIMNAIGDDDDPYYDFTTSLRETMPEFIVSGIPSALTQGNIASRTGFRDMPLIGFMPGVGSGASKSSDAEGVIMDTLKVATGPVGGLFLNIGRGVDQINDGKVYRGLETMAPSQIKNFMKGYRFVDEGTATTLRGDPLGEVTTYDAAMQALGFAPLPIATQQEKNNAVVKIQTEAMRSKQRAYALINLAQDSNDSEGFDDALKLVDEHNKRFPGFEIKPDQLISSLEKHAKRSAEMLNGVYIEKGLRPYLNKIAD